jgi:Tol biopolymer transport system component
MSPDGRHLALTRALDGNRNIWLLDLGRSALSRFTFAAGNDVSPLWSPDGDRIVFASSRSGVLGIYQKRVGGGPEEPVLVTAENTNTAEFSPDGSVLLYLRADPQTLLDIWALPAGSGETPFAVVRTPREDLNGVFAPNGTWLAYQSNESGTYQVVVRPFRGAGRQLQISTDGGTQPRWRSDGRELFYLALDRQLMAVPVTFGDDGRSIDVGRPSALFQTRIGGDNIVQKQYLVSPDGQRFLLDTPIGGTPPITVLLNWRTPS